MTEVTPAQADMDAATNFSTRYLYPNCQGVRLALATTFSRHAEQARREGLEQAAVIAEGFNVTPAFDLPCSPYDRTEAIAQAIRAAKEQ